MAWNWSASTWRKASEEGKSWRSSEFNAIEKAIGSYSPVAEPKVRLQKLRDILEAIAKWWSWKQEKKFKHVDKPVDKTVPGSRKFAASEEELQTSGKLGEGESFSVRAEVVRGLVKDVVSEIDDVLAVDRSAWGRKHFTEPTKHTDDDFMYLVTAQTETPLEGEPEYRLNTIKNPSLIENAVISASVIKSGNVKLWGPAGFVLSAPKRCVGAAAKEDVKTANAVAMKHTVEKYIEMLRVYLNAKPGAADPSENIGLGSPESVLPSKMNHHSEVVVLGKSYDKTTTVSAVYVLVDQVGAGVDDIQPGACFQQISQFITTNPPKATYVVQPQPIVTKDRMDLYRKLAKEKGYPIVQIPIDKSTRLDATYFQQVYKGAVMFPFDPSTMVMHGSKEHRALEASAKAAQAKKQMKLDDHTCDICGAAVAVT